METIPNAKQHTLSSTSHTLTKQKDLGQTYGTCTRWSPIMRQNKNTVHLGQICRSMYRLRSITVRNRTTPSAVMNKDDWQRLQSHSITIYLQIWCRREKELRHNRSPNTDTWWWKHKHRRESRQRWHSAPDRSLNHPQGEVNIGIFRTGRKEIMWEMGFTYAIGLQALFIKCKRREICYTQSKLTRLNLHFFCSRPNDYTG